MHHRPPKVNGQRTLSRHIEKGNQSVPPAFQVVFNEESCSTRRFYRVICDNRVTLPTLSYPTQALNRPLTLANIKHEALDLEIAIALTNTHSGESRVYCPLYFISGCDRSRPITNRRFRLIHLKEEHNLYAFSLKTLEYLACGNEIFNLGGPSIFGPPISSHQEHFQRVHAEDHQLAIPLLAYNHFLAHHAPILRANPPPAESICDDCSVPLLNRNL